MEINELFHTFASKKIAVVGDVMIDAYIHGAVHRISPEAPVPIVNLSKTEERLGGAANVAQNIIALGAEVVICSVIGTDREGDHLIQLLQERSINCDGIVQSDERITTVKTRVIGNNQQMVRIDSEQSSPISSIEEKRIIEQIKQVILDGVDALIFQDYNKGVLTPTVIEALINFANEHNVPTTVDPKKDNFLAYKNVTLFKPNFKELKEGLGLLGMKANDQAAILAAKVELQAQLNNQITFVTLSEFGVFINQTAESHFIPAHLRNITDVSGAGDTVISVATLCLAAGLPIRSIASIANLAGGLVCEQSGVVSIDKESLSAELKRLQGEIQL